MTATTMAATESPIENHCNRVDSRKPRTDATRAIPDGAWVEVSFSEWRGVDRVKERPQLGDAHLDDLRFPRDGIPGGERICVHERG